MTNREPTTEPLIHCGYYSDSAPAYTELVSFELSATWTVELQGLWPDITVGASASRIGGWFEGESTFISGAQYIFSVCVPPGDSNVARVSLSPRVNPVPMFEWRFYFG